MQCPRHGVTGLAYLPGEGGDEVVLVGKAAGDASPRDGCACLSRLTAVPFVALGALLTDEERAADHADGCRGGSSLRDLGLPDEHAGDRVPASVELVGDGADDADEVSVLQRAVVVAAAGRPGVDGSCGAFDAPLCRGEAQSRTIQELEVPAADVLRHLGGQDILHEAVVVDHDEDSADVGVLKCICADDVVRIGRGKREAGPVRLHDVDSGIVGFIRVQDAVFVQADAAGPGGDPLHRDGDGPVGRVLSRFACRTGPSGHALLGVFQDDRFGFDCQIGCHGPSYCVTEGRTLNWPPMMYFRICSPETVSTVQTS